MLRFLCPILSYLLMSDSQNNKNGRDSEDNLVLLYHFKNYQIDLLGTIVIPEEGSHVHAF